jgi:hypothetical protein
MPLLAVLRPIIEGIFFLHQLITPVIYTSSWVGFLACSSHPDDHFTPIGYRGLRPMGGFFSTPPIPKKAVLHPRSLQTLYRVVPVNRAKI